MSRNVIVTGAASGIGRAIVERLTTDGDRVLAVDIAPAAGPGEPFGADLTTRDGNRTAVAAALERFRSLDAVVANAGVQHIDRIADLSEDKWDELVALLLTSPYLLAKYAWEALTRSQAGRFVAIASVHGLVASPLKGGYVSAKHGVLGLVKTLALEGAPESISAIAVCPGFVKTPLAEQQIAAQAGSRGISEDRVLHEIILEPHAVKRLIEPVEIADVVAYLLGPQGQLFTGSAVTIDLGWSAR